MHPSPMNAVLALPRWFTQRPIQPMGLLYLASVIRREGHRARETFVALGGPHASSLPDRSMQECDALDAVVFGEGERTILEILDRLAARESLEGVHGTAYRDPGGIVVNASRELVDDLDAIPFPAWDLIPMHKYVASTWFPNKVKQYTNIFTSRPNFFISDDLFTLKRERVLDICNLILEKQLPITWTCLSRVNTVDPEMLALMKQAGCYLISYGLESRSQEVLDKLDKGTTVEQGIAAVEMTKAAGIKVFGSFMIGSPGETIETVEATIKLIRKLKLDEVGLGVTTAYPGTDLFDTFGSDAKDLDWDKALAFNPSAADHSDVFLKCTDLDDEQIRRLFHKAMREAVLFNPRLLVRRLSHLASVRHLGQSAKAAVRIFTG